MLFGMIYVLPLVGGHVASAAFRVLFCKIRIHNCRPLCLYFVAFAASVEESA